MATRKEKRERLSQERSNVEMSKITMPVMAINLYDSCSKCENNCAMEVDSLVPVAFLEPVTRHICKLKCRKDLYTQRRLHEDKPFDYKVMKMPYGDLRATCPNFAIILMGNDEFMRKSF